MCTAGTAAICSTLSEEIVVYGGECIVSKRIRTFKAIADKF